ncbi:MAG: hypothetical protein E6J14_14960 [Chloroflexi bacterium]|nr:MAG: hypothetical protein E6J14_14960 [Chloroflexota bacterium]
MTDALARMASDDAFVQAVRTNAEEALAGYELTDDERRSLAAVRTEAAGRGPSSLGQRLSKSGLFGMSGGGGGTEALPAPPDSLEADGQLGGDLAPPPDIAVDQMPDQSDGPWQSLLAAGTEMDTTVVQPVDGGDQGMVNVSSPDATATDQSMDATSTDTTDRTATDQQLSGAAPDGQPTDQSPTDQSPVQAGSDPGQAAGAQPTTDAAGAPDGAPNAPSYGPDGTWIHAEYDPQSGEWVDPVTGAHYNAATQTWYEQATGQAYQPPDTDPPTYGPDGRFAHPRYDFGQHQWIDQDTGARYDTASQQWLDPTTGTPLQGPTGDPPMGGPDGHPVHPTYDFGAKAWTDPATGALWDPDKQAWVDPFSGNAYPPDYSGPAYERPTSDPFGTEYAGLPNNVTYDPARNAWVDPMTGALYDPNNNQWYSPWDRHPFEPSDPMPSTMPPGFDPFGQPVHAVWDPSGDTWVDPTTGARFDQSTGTWSDPLTQHVYTGAEHRPPAPVVLQPPDELRHEYGSHAITFGGPPTAGPLGDGIPAAWDPVLGQYYDPTTGLHSVNGTWYSPASDQPSEATFRPGISPPPAEQPTDTPSGSHAVYDPYSQQWRDPVTKAWYSAKGDFWFDPAPGQVHDAGDFRPSAPPPDTGPTGDPVKPTWDFRHNEYVDPASGRVYSAERGFWYRALPASDSPNWEHPGSPPPASGPTGKATDPVWDRENAEWLDQSTGARYDPLLGTWSQGAGAGAP